MQCRTCGVTYPGMRVEGVCPRCSFDSALQMGLGQGAAGIEGYEMIEELGRGAMGVVWLARDRSLDRLVALKLIAVADPRLQQRLFREGKAAARLRHPHIVAVYAMGGDGPQPYLSMEFVEGGNLETRLDGKPMPPRDAAVIASKVAGALQHAHESGVLHRDVKPSNILLAGDEPKLADFGMAAPLEGAGDLTVPGTIAGTPAYLAPELLGGSEKAGTASDIYSVGAVLYSCLTGRAPFVGPSAAAILAQLPTGEPLAPRLLQPGVPEDLETICLKCLEKAPDRRYGSAALLKADLDAYLRGEPITARPVGIAGRVVRYFRRRPGLAVATGLAAALTLTLAIGGPLMALRLARSERAAVAARLEAEKARASTLERLRESLIARSRATRLAGGKGQRDEALESAVEAARIRVGQDVRDEVVAALARPEVEVVSQFPLKCRSEGVVSFDPDHRQYVAEAALGLLELRSLDDNHLMESWHIAAERLWSFPLFSPDGRWVCVRDAVGNDFAFRTNRADPVFSLPDRHYALAGRYTGYGRPSAFSPDGLTFASALSDTGVSLHATVDGHELRRIPTSGAVTHLMYSSDGRWLAVGRGLHGNTAAKGPFLMVVDAATGAKVCSLSIGPSFQTISWEPGGSRLLVCGDEILMFGVPSGVMTRRLIDPLASKAFYGPGGSTIISMTSGGFATLWDEATAKPLLMTSLGTNAVGTVSGDGSLIAKEVGGAEAAIFGIEMPKVVRTLPNKTEGGHYNVVSAAIPVVEYAPDGRWLATAVWGEVQLRAPSGDIVAVSEQGSDGNYCNVRFSRDGGSLLASSNELGLVRVPIVTATDGTTRLGASMTIDPEPGYFIADVSRDGKKAVLTSFLHGHCKIVDLEGNSPAVKWPVAGAAGAVFLRGDNDVLVNSLEDGNGAMLELRSVRTGERDLVLQQRHGAHAHVSADGSWLMVGTGEDSSVLLRTADWSTGPRLPAEVQGRGEQPAFSPDGSYLAIGTGKTVVLVRTSDGSVIANLLAPQGGSYLPGLTFSPDGSHLALWWENGQLTLWDLRVLRHELAVRGLDW